MASLPLKLTVSAIAIVFALAAAVPANAAQARNHKKHVTAPTPPRSATANIAGRSCFPPGRSILPMIIWERIRIPSSVYRSSATLALTTAASLRISPFDFRSPIG
ncbi:MAG TPA: hypothetical protein VFC45_04690 [Pseudolabrys sp.]|nr:hypothetical protein [Pseudolabrys sp.]